MAKVFISSTGEDLSEYREAAIAVCNQLELIPVAMELFESMEAGATEGSKRKLDECHVYVGVFAYRYGYVEAGYERSVTEIEYEHAGERRIDRLCFVIHPEHVWPPGRIDENRERIEKLKKRIGQSHCRGERFTTVDDFRSKLIFSLAKWVEGQGPQRPCICTLPTPPGDFTGRESELNCLLHRLKSGSVSISGIRGTAGVGKTALALKVGHLLTGDYPDGQIYCDLRGADPQPRTPPSVMAQVIHAFDPDRPLPDNEDALGGDYRSTLAGRRVLLLMDNVGDGRQLGPLVPPPGCLLLFTSRQKFEIPGMLREDRLDLDTMSECDARHLLLRLHEGLREHAGVVAELCGHLPLALRLAAGALARTPHLTAQRYVERLKERLLDLHVGDVSLRASIGLSYSMLAPKLQSRFCLLGLFPASFHPDAALAAWGTSEDEALETIGELVKYSLIEYNAGAGRYQLHDLVRLFADSELDDALRSAGLTRLAEYYATLLQALEKDFREGGQSLVDALQAFDQEWPSVSTTFAWLTGRMAQDAVAARLCSDCARAAFLILDHRHFDARQSWLEAGLEAARRVHDRAAQGVHLRRFGWQHLYVRRGDPAKTLACYEEALDIFRGLGDGREEAIVLSYMGGWYASSREHGRAIHLLDQSLALSRDVGDHRTEGVTLGRLASTCDALGQLDRAIEYYEQAIGVERKIGDLPGEAIDLANLAGCLDRAGQASRADECWERALDIRRQLKEPERAAPILLRLAGSCDLRQEPARASAYYDELLTTIVAMPDTEARCAALSRLGVTLLERGRASHARACIEEALNLHPEHATKWGLANMLGDLGRTCAGLGQLDRAIECYEQAVAVERRIDDLPREAIDLDNLACCLDRAGQASRADECWERALAIWRQLKKNERAIDILLKLAASCDLRKEAARASAYYDELLTTIVAMPDTEARCAALSKLGVTLLKSGRASRARACLDEALKLHPEHGTKRGLGNVLGNLGCACAELDELADAIEYHQKALAIDDELGDREGKAIGSWDLGETYERRAQEGDLARAAELMQVRVDLLRELGDADAEKLAERLEAIRKRLAGGSGP